MPTNGRMHIAGLAALFALAACSSHSRPKDSDTPAPQPPELVAKPAVTGEVKLAQGTIWRAGLDSCDAVETPTGTQFKNCSAVDLTIPMQTLDGLESTSKVAMTFTCTSAESLALDVSVGKSYVNHAWQQNGDPVEVEEVVNVGEKPVIRVRMAAFGPSQVVDDKCGVELVESGAAAVSAPVEAPRAPAPRDPAPAAPAPAAPTPAAPVLGELAYSFPGIDDDFKTCSTGVKQFETKVALCMGLQSPTDNANNCAVAERMARFDEVCKPTFEWFGARACDIGLYAKDAKFTFSGPAPEPLHHERLCVGRVRSGSSIGPLFLENGQFDEHVRLSAEMALIRKSERYAGHQPIMRFKVSSADGTRSLTDWLAVDPDTAASGVMARTSDGEYQVAVSCHNTWACDAEMR